jgi:hypothetical protein
MRVPTLGRTTALLRSRGGQTLLGQIGAGGGEAVLGTSGTVEQDARRSVCDEEQCPSGS